MSTLINICSASRSGSTMLDLMLGNTPDAFSCGEVYAWFRPYRKHHFDIDCSCGQNPCPIWEKIKDVSENQFHATVFKKLGVNFIVDSSKDPTWVLDTHTWAASNSFEVINILIWKDPVDLAYSYWKRGYKLDSWRKPFVSYYSKLLQIKIPIMAVSFNELTRNPQNKLMEICDFIGMPYFEGKERFWENQPHYLFGSGGVRNQVEAKESKIRKEEKRPPEFQAKIEDLSKQISADSKVQQILSALQRVEISSVDHSKLRNTEIPSHLVYPAWYYMWKIRQVYRRFFPQQVDPKK